MTTESENGVREQFEMGPHAELSVSNVSGSVTVDAVDGSQITVRARRSRSRSRDNAEIDIRKDGNKVSVQTKTGQFGLMNFGKIFGHRILDNRAQGLQRSSQHRRR